jgi:quinol monooxygenase YgiN
MNGMIVIAGKVTVRRERRDEAVRAALAMAEATRKEEGCLAYQFSSDLADPDTIFIFEEWASEETLARHFQTEHIRVFRQQIAGLVAGPPAIKRYSIESVSVMT